MNATATKRIVTTQRTLESPEADSGDLLLTAAVEATIDRLDSTGRRFRDELDKAQSELRRSLIMASAIEALDKAITPDVMKLARRLMNTQLGFKTDRPNKNDKSEYPDGTIKECLIAATLYGFRWTGNEFNIIAEQFYGAKEGWRRKVLEIEGITDVRIAVGSPMLDAGRQKVRVALSWLKDGIAGELRGADGKSGMVFPITSFNNSSADQLMGKAERKAYKRAYEQITGSRQTVPDGDVNEAAESAVAAEVSRTKDVIADLKAKHGNGNGNGANASAKVKRIKELAASFTAEEVAALSERLGNADPSKLGEAEQDELILQLEANKDTESVPKPDREPGEEG